jgi:hypothetical protein
MSGSGTAARGVTFGTTDLTTALAVTTTMEVLLAMELTVAITGALSTLMAAREPLAVLDMTPAGMSPLNVTTLNMRSFNMALLNVTALNMRSFSMALLNMAELFSRGDESVPTLARRATFLATGSVSTMAFAAATFAAMATNVVRVLGPTAVCPAAVCPAAVASPEFFDSRVMGLAAIRIERVTKAQICRSLNGIAEIHRGGR